MKEKKNKNGFKNFLLKVALFFKALFNKVARFFEQDGQKIITFLNAVKSVVDNPALTLLVAASNNKIDDLILFKLSKALGKAIDIMEINTECMLRPTLNEKIACYILYLRTCSPEIRNAIYHKTASIIARETAREKGLSLSNSEIDTMIQIEYAKSK